MYKNGMKFNAAQVAENEENKRLEQSYSAWYQRGDFDKGYEDWLIRAGLLSTNSAGQVVH
jgi:hypothetical protein